MLTLFYVLVVEQILQGVYNLWDGLRWLRLAQRRAATHSGFYAPRVALFCPVKGAEPGLELNISALAGFDYPDYEIFFSMASADDPARKIIERVTAGSKHKVHIVVAGRPSECGEKVNNLRAAILKADKDFDVFVFADSDGRPGRSWLARLVAPLEDSKLGAITTFRWFMPQIGGLWSALASAWNAPAATYLGEHDRNFCWGGGTAIRRAHFEKCNVLEYWNGSVSDDFSLTRALRQSNMSIEFAPECIVPTMFDCDAKSLIEFTNRQIIITRIYEPRLWVLGGLGHAFYCVAIVLGVGLFLNSLMNGTSGIQLLLLATLLPVLSMGRGVLRLAAMVELLPEWKTKLLADGWIWTFLAAIAPAIGLWNTFAALFSRE
ncbi:MAG TPA: glycosyltransferase, partial [Candidatus Acidoferrales bacterium]|nr:glycosyltransferase [Candidatus Acidoferrales bacterium]